MQDWQGMFLGLRRLPRDLSAFELEAFFTFVGAEQRAIEERRQLALKLGLALQMGFLRMTGRPLEAVGAVPPALWRHLGAQSQVTAPDLASLRGCTGGSRRSTSTRSSPVRCSAFGMGPRRSAVHFCARCAMSWHGQGIVSGCAPLRDAGCTSID